MGCPMSRLSRQRTHQDASTNANEHNVELTADEVRPCHICIGLETPENPFSHKCENCKQSICANCIISMFRQACKDESLMPPRCCYVIQLSSALPYLTNEEIDLFKLKYEEWSTPNRVYCPVKTCSTFIPKDYMTGSWGWGRSLAKTVGGVWVCENSPTRLLLPGKIEICPKQLESGKKHLTPNLSNRTTTEVAVDTSTSENIHATSSAIGKECRTKVLDRESSNEDVYFRVACAAKGRGRKTQSFDRESSKKNEFPTAGSVKAKEHERNISHRKSFNCTLFPLSTESSANRAWEIKPPRTSATSIANGYQRMFPCRSCQVMICLRCKQLAHPESRKCPITKDPEFEALLSKWNIKRCPKCSQGIRLMFGCSHIQCRCGANWCWFCQQPIVECRRGDCTEAGRREEAWTDEELSRTVGRNDAMGGRNNEDLDQGWDWDERAMDFGVEPLGRGHGWGCTHHWIVADEVGICHQCFQVIPITATDPKVAKPDDGSETLITEASDRPLHGEVKSGQAEEKGLVFQCANCRILSCNECKGERHNRHERQT